MYVATSEFKINKHSPVTIAGDRYRSVTINGVQKTAVFYYIVWSSLGVNECYGCCRRVPVLVAVPIVIFP